MHKIGCPKRNNPYGTCECAAMDLRDHTEQLRQFIEFQRSCTINDTSTMVADMERENSALRAEIECWRDSNNRLHNKCEHQGALNDTLLARIHAAELATQAHCTCGGNPPENPKCCPACHIYHALKGTP